MKSGRSASKKAYTLIEILIVVVLIIVMASLLLSGISNVIQSTQEAQCISNLRNVWAASLSYAADNDGSLPPNQSGSAVFATFLRPYLGDSNVGQASLQHSALVCPSDKYPANQPYFIGSTNNGYALSYAQNGYFGDASAKLGAGGKMGSWRNASHLAALMDYEMHYVAGIGTWDIKDRLTNLMRRHNGRMNVIFCDGHAESPFITNMDVNIPNMFWQGR